MTFRRFYTYFINPMLAIFLIPIVSAYFQRKAIDYQQQLIIAIICGLLLGCIYCGWDHYKSKKVATDESA